MLACQDLTCGATRSRPRADEPSRYADEPLIVRVASTTSRASATAATTRAPAAPIFVAIAAIARLVALGLVGELRCSRPE
jgi:hypothetical protein